MSVRFILCLAFLLLPALTRAQLSIRFSPLMNGAEIVPGKTYSLNGEGDSVRIDALRFYLAKPASAVNENNIIKLQPEYFLPDIENPSSLEITFPETPFSAISNLSFDLGIDSLTSTSGAMSGVLDPVKGMYWTWQSGFINFKAEGLLLKKDGSRKEFIFHLGGYRHPFNALRRIHCEVENKSFSADFAPFFSYALGGDNLNVMSPGERAVKLSEKAAACFNDGNK